MVGKKIRLTWPLRITVINKLLVAFVLVSILCLSCYDGAQSEEVTLSNDGKAMKADSLNRR